MSNHSNTDLTPVDEYINNLQKSIDDALWEGDWEDAEFLERELKYYKKLQMDGVLYEPNF